MKKVIKLKESDIKKIVKRVLKESDVIDDLETHVLECVGEHCDIQDITSIPQSCIKMIVDKDVTLAYNCMMEMDSDTVQMILGKIGPISSCVANKVSTPVMN